MFYVKIIIPFYVAFLIRILRYLTFLLFEHKIRKTEMSNKNV